jgi:hypothetical protein
MSTDLTHQIRERAYQLWTAAPDRSDVDHWLTAEREIMALHSAKPAKKARSPRRRTH